ncbi:MAG: magnesium transporter CorA [Euryarchaeota archaeon]|nr:magnesium transporter CorA [Euryarchaeota archaeon]
MAMQPPEAKPDPGLEKRGVCIAISRAGKPVRLFADSPSEFISCIKDAEIAWVNFSVQDLDKDGVAVASLLGFSGSLVTFLTEHRQSAYDDRETELGIKLPVVRVHAMDVDTFPLVVLIRRGLILTLHDKNVTRMAKFARYADTFMRKIKPETPWNDKLTIVLIRLINENNDRNFDGLRSIQERGEDLGKYLINPTQPSTTLGPQIYSMKHALIAYLDALWATLDVIQNLRYGDAELISDDETILGRVGVLADDVTRQISLSEHMSEVLASGLEVLQSIYNNQLQLLNNRLTFVVTWLTILGTAVLVPNTLATILSNPAYGLGPADAAWYTTVIVGSTAGATVLTWFVVRRWLQPPATP